MNRRLYLVVMIAGEKVAFPAEPVGSVVELDHVTPVPRVPGHIAGLFALRSRVMTVVDGRMALGFPAASYDEGMTGVIVSVDGHAYALLVDSVDDVVSLGEPGEATPVLSANWARVTIGQVNHQDRSLLLIDPVLLITGGEPARAAA